MKKILSVLSLVIGMFAFAQKVPTEIKTEFNQKALQDVVETFAGETITLENALAKYKGNVTVIDLYAIWCGDCIKGLPKLKELQANNPEVKFVFLSMDRTKEAWKDGIEKYQIEGEYLYMGNNWKNEFSTYIDLNWIPRYLILDQEGKIANYYTVKADDPTVQSTLDSLKS